MQYITTLSKKLILLLFLLLTYSNLAHSQLFESLFKSEKYIVFHSPSPLQLDGAINEKQWEAVPWANPFVDIEGNINSKPTYETKVKMLWDNKYFYIAACLYDKHIWATMKERESAIFEDNDFEVYIDPDGDSHNYMKLEINALGTLSDLFMELPYRDGGEADMDWNFEGIKSAVKVYGKINISTKRDSCWTVELAIPWKSMIEFSNSKKIPVNGEQWRVNFLRINWKTTIKDYKYQKDKGPNKKPLPPFNWVWSPQGSPEMHQPETWGYVQFAANAIGDSAVSFNTNPDENIIWSLWQIYYLYQTYPRNYAKIEENLLIFKNKKYASSDDFAEIELGKKNDKFIATAPSTINSGNWYINKEGRIWFEKAFK